MVFTTRDASIFHTPQVEGPPTSALALAQLNPTNWSIPYFYTGT